MDGYHDRERYILLILRMGNPHVFLSSEVACTRHCRSLVVSHVCRRGLCLINYCLIGVTDVE